MDPKKNYYEILGVPETAGAEEVRKAFRRLAKKFHPDMNPGDKGAETKFKEINEAHEVLSDGKKRKEYDAIRKGVFTGGFGRGGASQEWPGGFGRGDVFGRPEVFDVEDILGDILGGGRSAFTPGGVGRDIQMELAVDFLGMAQGAEREVQYARPATCPICGGSGRGDRRICTGCRGSGVREVPERITVRIPPGAQDGSKIRIPGRGEAGRRKSGDLVIRLRMIPHPSFRRDGHDIHIDVPIHYSEAVKGAKIQVPTIDGLVTVTIPPGSSSGRKLRLKGKGVPMPGRAGRGDQYITLQVAVPRAGAARKEFLELVDRLAAYEDPNLRREWN
jgi:molecular chaperone DnaJ